MTYIELIAVTCAIKITLTCMYTYMYVYDEMFSTATFCQTITLKALMPESTGLSGIYSAILDFFPKQCSLLREFTHPRPRSGASQPPRVPGFDFLVNAVWPEVVAVLEERVSVIFAPGNPNSFHKVPATHCY